MLMPMLRLSRCEYQSGYPRGMHRDHQHWDLDRVAVIAVDVDAHVATEPMRIPVLMITMHPARIPALRKVPNSKRQAPIRGRGSEVEDQKFPSLIAMRLRKLHRQSRE